MSWLVLLAVVLFSAVSSATPSQVVDRRPRPAPHDVDGSQGRSPTRAGRAQTPLAIHYTRGALAWSRQRPARTPSADQKGRAWSGQSDDESAHDVALPETAQNIVKRIGGAARKGTLEFWTDSDATVTQLDDNPMGAYPGRYVLEDIEALRQSGARFGVLSGRMAKELRRLYGSGIEVVGVYGGEGYVQTKGQHPRRRLQRDEVAQRAWKAFWPSAQLSRALEDLLGPKDQSRSRYGEVEIEEKAGAAALKFRAWHNRVGEGEKAVVRARVQQTQETAQRAADDWNAAHPEHKPIEVVLHGGAELPLEVEIRVESTKASYLVDRVRALPPGTTIVWSGDDRKQDGPAMAAMRQAVRERNAELPGAKRIQLITIAVGPEDFSEYRPTLHLPDGPRQFQALLHAAAGGRRGEPVYAR